MRAGDVKVGAGGVLGSALGGGLVPLAAVIASEALDAAPELTLGFYTHERNAFSAAIGLATLSVILDEGLPERAHRLGERVQSRLAGMAEGGSPVAEFRSIGLMFALDLQGSRGAKHLHLWKSRPRS